MSLPILNIRTAPSATDLLRLFAKTELHFAQHAGESTTLDVGTAVCNPAMRDVPLANQVLDVTMPDGMGPVEIVRVVDEHFGSQNARCMAWHLNTSMPADRATLLREHLLSQGWIARSMDVYLLQRAANQRIDPPADVKIIPARASFRHMRQLADEMTGGRAAHADAEMAHLDDPHWDALLALRDGSAIACAGVLAVGEIGRIDSLYVAPSQRRSGLGQHMLWRILEICVRAQFRQVMMKIAPDNVAGTALAQKFGFARMGHIEQFFSDRQA